MSGKTQVAKTKDLPPGKAVAVTVGSKRIAVFNSAGNFFAIDDTCTHAGGSLSEGDLAGNIITCPWHGAAFDITNGNVLEGPASESVKSYKVFVEGEDIKVEV